MKREEIGNKVLVLLISSGITCAMDKNTYCPDIINENFRLSIDPQSWERWNHGEQDFSKIKISVKTESYPHTFRRISKFNTATDDYQEIVEKVKEIIKEDKKLKDKENKEEKAEKENLEILKKSLAEFDKHSEKYSNCIYLETPYFRIRFYANSKGIETRIDEKHLSMEKAIELFKKVSK